MGQINHPTLSDICRMVVIAGDKWGSENVVLFKEDIKGFYTQCYFLPEDAHKMAFAVFSPDPRINGLCT